MAGFSDNMTVQVYSGLTLALKAFPDDWRFRLALPPWAYADTVVSWSAPGIRERVLTEGELEDDGEFLWCQPVGIEWSGEVNLFKDHRLTVHRRSLMVQTWDPTPNSAIKLPDQADRLDRVVRMIQQVAERAFNALGWHPQERPGLTGREVPLEGRTIPLPAERRGKLLGFEDTPDALVKAFPTAELASAVAPGVADYLANETGLVQVPSLQLSGPQVFTYPRGALVPMPSSPKTITASISRMVPASIMWAVWNADHWADVVEEPGRLIGQGTRSLVVSYDSSVWGSDRQIRLRCTASGPEGVAYDEFTLYKVADGLDGYTIILSNEDHGILCSADGTPVAGELGAGGRAQTKLTIKRGAQDLTPVNRAPGPGEYQVKDLAPTGCTASIVGLDSVRVDDVATSAGAVIINLLVEDPANGFQKPFTWRKSLQGQAGVTGAQGTRASRFLGMVVKSAGQESQADAVAAAIPDLLVKGDFYLFSTSGVSGQGDSEFRAWDSSTWYTVTDPPSDLISAAQSLILQRATFLEGGTQKAVQDTILVDQLFTRLLSAKTVLVKGEVRAESGYFKGHVEASSGSFEGEIRGESGYFKGEMQAAFGQIGNMLVPPPLADPSSILVPYGSTCSAASAAIKARLPVGSYSVGGRYGEIIGGPPVYYWSSITRVIVSSDRCQLEGIVSPGGAPLWVELMDSDTGNHVQKISFGGMVAEASFSGGILPSEKAANMLGSWPLPWAGIWLGYESAPVRSGVYDVISNSSGTAVRFTSGIQICFFIDSVATRMLGGTLGQNKDFVYPAAFSAPARALGLYSWSSGFSGWASVTSYDRTRCTVVGFSGDEPKTLPPYTPTTYGYLGYVAFGYWDVASVLAGSGR